LEIRVKPGRETVAVRPAGELDLPGSRRLSAAIDEFVEAGSEDIVFALAGSVRVLPFDRRQA
jgi:hypothetical protein